MEKKKTTYNSSHRFVPFSSKLQLAFLIHVWCSDQSKAQHPLANAEIFYLACSFFKQLATES